MLTAHARGAESPQQQPLPAAGRSPAAALLASLRQPCMHRYIQLTIAGFLLFLSQKEYSSQASSQLCNFQPRSRHALAMRPIASASPCLTEQAPRHRPGLALTMTPGPPPGRPRPCGCTPCSSGSRAAAPPAAAATRGGCHHHSWLLLPSSLASRSLVPGSGSPPGGRGSAVLARVRHARGRYAAVRAVRQ
jgi:hypothetical protein